MPHYFRGTGESEAARPRNTRAGELDPMHIHTESTRNGFAAIAPGSPLVETEIVYVHAPIRIWPRRPIALKPGIGVAADLLLVDHAYVGTGGDVGFDVLSLDR